MKPTLLATTFLLLVPVVASVGYTVLRTSEIVAWIISSEVATILTILAITYFYENPTV